MKMVDQEMMEIETAFQTSAIQGRIGSDVTDNYLEIVNLSKCYSESYKAVANISLDIRKGEFVSFLGPSGSGKTTTLMMVAGFESPTSGIIRLGGHDISPMPPHKRNIGMVFQSYALFPHMTAAENVAFPLRMRGLSKQEITRRSNEALAMVSLADFGERHPRSLSGGQQQRVALARALVFGPDVLLLDEPLGALDKNLREQMQMEIKRIHRELGITTIYVTHDQTEAMTMSDRIAVFRDGIVEQFAPPLEVYHRPTTKFVGGFVGDNNFLTADVSSEEVILNGIGTLSRLNCTVGGAGSFDVLLRPEAICLWSEEAELKEDHIAVDCFVDILVNHGDSIFLVGCNGDLKLRARLPFANASRVREGDRLRLAWRRRDMHFIAR